MSLPQFSSTPYVSVILPTKNANSVIVDCLDSLKAQTYSNFEIIGIDAGSTDGTFEAMKNITHLFDFAIDASMPWGTPYQVVFGASHAVGKYLYFVDSDMTLLPNAIDTYVKEIELQRSDGLIIPEISFGNGFWAKCKVLERSAYFSGDVSIEAPRFIRKTTWDELGGYDPAMGGLLDWDFHSRLKAHNKKIARSNIPVYHNEGRLTLLRLIKKKYTYGKTTGRYFRRHWREAEVIQSQFNPFRPAFLRNWKSLLRDPIHAWGMVVMKFVEGSAMALGYLGSYLKRTRKD